MVINTETTGPDPQSCELMELPMSHYDLAPENGFLIEDGFATRSWLQEPTEPLRPETTMRHRASML